MTIHVRAWIPGDFVELHNSKEPNFPGDVCLEVPIEEIQHLIESLQNALEFVTPVVTRDYKVFN